MIREDLQKLNPPDLPGVYLMHDAGGKIIYVGKAISLRKRLANYFRDPAQLDPKTQALVQRIASIETVVTRDEVQALILEYNLIKKHRPRYNVLMKDDKSFPYLKLTVQEDFPRLLMTRKPFADDSRYFGPFIHGSLKSLARTISLHFGLRLCKFELKRGTPLKRACLYAQLSQCDAVCRGEQGTEAYAGRVQAVLDFLEGGEDTLSPRLEQTMRQAAAAQNFELAASLRDQLNAIGEIRQKPLLASTGRENRDVVGLARLGTAATVEIFTVRSGNVEGRRRAYLQHVGAEPTEDLLAQVLGQLYSQTGEIPPEILLSSHPADEPLLLDWLAQRRGEPVKLRVPRGGDEYRLVKLAETNAWLYLKHSASAEPNELSEEDRAALSDLAQRLGLAGPPLRLEAYDISNISGTDAVGSGVVFTNGQPDKNQYRRYRIRGVSGPNDFAMLQEMLFRRLKRLQESGGSVPDLMVIDGGAGQLSAVLAVLKELGMEHLPVIGLAKQFEEIFLPGKSQPLRLPENSRGLRILKRLRDEAHRFAVTYHRKIRGKRMKISDLDKVEGLGPVKRRELLRSLGSMDAILQVSESELAKIKGIGSELAKRIQQTLKAIK